MIILIHIVARMKLFGTDGIRGTANVFPITPEVALRTGRAIAFLLSKISDDKPVVLIGRDTRISGQMLETSLAAGLMSAGVNVILAGVLPTPAVAHLTASGGYMTGVMLTASHNPFEDNGLKIFAADGYKLSDDMEEKVERFILDPSSENTKINADQVGHCFLLEDGAENYSNFVKKSLVGTSLEGIKIVLDCGNGAASEVAPALFRSLGAEVITHGIDPDGININADCGALHPERTAELVVENKAQIGVSFDGDADRAIFTDAEGKTVSGDRIMALCAIALKNHNALRGNTIAVTVMTNLGLHAAMKEQGINVITTGVGDKQVIEALRSYGYSFGGENSGHLIFTDYATTGDGIMSALQILRVMKESQKSLAELAACMDEYPSELRSFKVPAKPPLESLTTFQQKLKAAEHALGQQGRHLIRYSGTENKVRVLVEHAEEEMVKYWTEELSVALLDAINESL